MDIDKERRDYAAWIKPANVETMGENMWLAWQARAALASQGAQKPVGKVVRDSEGCDDVAWLVDSASCDIMPGDFLYTAPPAAVPAPDLQTEIDRLTECLKKANAQAEHFERECYLRGDEIEALKAAAPAQAVDALPVPEPELSGYESN